MTIHPSSLAAHYTRFRVAERVLLSGHSHQAWPDVAFDAQQQAWLDAAEHVDDKWQHAYQQADAVRRGYARLLDAEPDEIALGPATHDLLVKLISALPLRERPRLVTTTGEFHTIRRQLQRLGEEGIEIVVVDAAPADRIAERLVQAIDNRTAAVFASSVLFRNARIVPDLGSVAAACERAGAACVVDAYHHLNVVPFSLEAMGLQSAFVTGGGYKYCQLGEGNAFLRVPPGVKLRPVVTGWFSEFGVVTKGGGEGEGTGTGTVTGAGGGITAGARVPYGAGPERFAGATYDPTSHYRGAAVFEFFDAMGLDPGLLREVSQHQVRMLASAFDELDLDPHLVSRDRDTPLEHIAGFLALRSPRAGEISRGLRAAGVFTDYREDVLRLGPAPYLSDEQLRKGIAALGSVVADQG